MPSRISGNVSDPGLSATVHEKDGVGGRSSKAGHFNLGGWGCSCRYRLHATKTAVVLDPGGVPGNGRATMRSGPLSRLRIPMGGAMVSGSQSLPTG